MTERMSPSYKYLIDLLTCHPPVSQKGVGTTMLLSFWTFVKPYSAIGWNSKLHFKIATTSNCCNNDVTTAVGNVKKNVVTGL